MQKYNGNDILEQTNYDDGGRGSNIGLPGIDRNIRTTEGEEISYDEPTNCRLREETNASMMFGVNQNTAPVKLN